MEIPCLNQVNVHVMSQNAENADIMSQYVIIVNIIYLNILVILDMSEHVFIKTNMEKLVHVLKNF